MKRTELPRAEALCARYLDKNRPAHAAQRLALRRLHDRAHRLVEALVLLFHLVEQADAGV